MKILGSLLDLVNKRVINVSDPASPQDAATKNYVDTIVRGLDWKQEVMATSTANVSLTAPGTSLDGVTLTAQDRVLLKDQTLPAENGVYLWTGAAAALVRTLDADTWTELTGATVTVQRGTVNADKVYRVTADDGGTLGTTAVTLALVGGAGSVYTAGNGLTLTSLDFNVGAGNGILVTADSVIVDPAVVARKFSTTVGNGTLTSFPVVHSLGTRDVAVVCYDVASFEEVLVDSFRTDANTVTIIFATAPAASSYRVVVIG